jgi:hypothetical protein
MSGFVSSRSVAPHSSGSRPGSGGRHGYVMSSVNAGSMNVTIMAGIADS